ncbi:MAG: hypothetical protein IKI41_05760 [Clostridia bacterium]|nr:hypothetical protein [Clostridia bacterium]
MAFEKLIGQEDVKRRLSAAVESEMLSHAYIFSGPDGIGKMTFALEFAGLAMCGAPVNGRKCGRCRACQLGESGNNVDLRIISPEEKKTQIGVEAVRTQICDEVFKAPVFSRKKVFIVDRADKMNESAQNALLKTFEEPPAYTLIILLCDSVLPLLETVKSRAVGIEFRRNTDGEIIQKYRELRDESARSGSVLPEIDTSLLCAYADGLMGRVGELCADGGELIRARIELVEKLSDLYAGKNGAKAAISSIIDVRNKNYDFAFFSMMSFTRDAMLIARFGSKTEIMNPDLKEQLSAMARDTGYYRLKNALTEIDTCYRNLARNAMPELATDNMLIRIAG